MFCLKKTIEMTIKHKFIDAEFINRPNRFLTRVKVGSEIIDSHLPDPGRLKELLIPGAKVLLKYENGKEFLDSEHLTDNDFDYMLTDKDLTTFCNNNYQNDTYIRIYLTYMRTCILISMDNGYIRGVYKLIDKYIDNPIRIDCSIYIIVWSITVLLRK